MSCQFDTKYKLVIACGIAWRLAKSGYQARMLKQGSRVQRSVSTFLLDELITSVR